MAITYPLTLPTSTGIEKITLHAVNTVALSVSPFTFQTQVFKYPAEMWSAEIQLPPLKRVDMEPWVAFLLSLKGKYGTFYLGDPLCTTAQGSAGGTPLINGASQTGEAINIDGLPISTTGWLLAGDYVQIGTGSSRTLHKVLQDVSSNGSGQATMYVWPSVRTAFADNTALTVSSPKGVFRLADNDISWVIDGLRASSYGISFNAQEAL